MTTKEDHKPSGSWKKLIIEWGILIIIAGGLYVTGYHTVVIGTLQKGLLATGLIKPDIPEASENFPDASRDFYFVDEQSAMTSLHDFEGKVIFLNIWATWCPPCIAEMPSIHSLYNRVSDTDNISFVLISMDEEFDKAKRFMENRGFTMPIYHYRNKAPGTYQSNVIPTTYIISPDGKLVMEKQGLAKYDTQEFEDFLRSLE